MMKHLLFAIGLFALSATPSLSAEKTVTLAVANMTCAVCPLTVSTAIRGVDGVIEVSVDYESKRASVRYDDTTATWREIARASKNAGYPAERVK